MYCPADWQAFEQYFPHPRARSERVTRKAVPHVPHVTRSDVLIGRDCPTTEQAREQNLPRPSATRLAFVVNVVEHVAQIRKTTGGVVALGRIGLTPGVRPEAVSAALGPLRVSIVPHRLIW